MRLTTSGARLVLLLGLSAGALAAEPRYEFLLKQDRSHALCSHMGSVFNTYFQNMWETPALDAISDYSATSKFAYPVPKGVPPIPEAVFLHRYSKWPQSPEFAAIPWVQARLRPLPKGNGRSDQQWQQEQQRLLARQRILVAHLDVDNDGVVDTLIKRESTPGYDFIVSPNNAVTTEEVEVIRSAAFDWPDQWPLDQFFERFPRNRIYVIAGSLVRPFVLNGKSYIARYSMNRGLDDTLVKRPPYRPNETMSVLSVSLPAPTGQWFPRVNERVQCEFQMRQKN